MPWLCPAAKAFSLSFKNWKGGEMGEQKEIARIPREVVLLGPTTAVCDPAIRGLCLRPYYQHPKGCPNYGKKGDCPPRALRNSRHWQGHLRSELRRFVLDELAGSYGEVIFNPEAMGVNLTATCAEVGLQLEWPPEKANDNFVRFLFSHLLKLLR